MEWVIVGLVAGLFFFIVVPWVAFAASGRSREALSRVASLQAEIASLRNELMTAKASATAVPAFADRPSPSVQAEEAQPQGEPPPPPPFPPEVDTADVQAPVPMDIPVDKPQVEDEIPLAARVAHEAEARVVAPPPPFEEIEHQTEAIAARTSRPDIEETIGSRWAVWIGGIALAFGGLFLVRYSIEAGLFGPGVRLLMGAAFAVILAGASEYLRRTERPLPFGGASTTLTANIPAVLAGVSVLAGFAVVFAAHAIYGFIGPTAAFLLMAIIGLSALAASLLHGPVLGLFGLVGSYVTPFLISSTAPAFASLSLFITFVTTIAFSLHLRRPSTIVTLSAVAGHAAWTILIAMAMQGAFWPAFLVVAGAVLAVLLVKELPAFRQQAPSEKWLKGGFEITSLAAIATPLIVSGIIWVGFGGPGAFNLAIVLTVAIGVIAATRHPDVAPLAPLSAAASIGMILLWPTQGGPLGLTPSTAIDLIKLSIVPDTAPGLKWTAFAFALIAGGIPLAALILRIRSGAGSFIVRGCLAFSSALALVCLLLATALRTNGFDRSLGYAALAALLTAALFGASEILLKVERTNSKSRHNPLALIGSAAYAAGGAIALGTAIAFALRETWLVVGFAISAAALAVLAKSRPIPLLRSMSATMATAAIARWIWDPILSDMGSWPILNWLIPAYALPALCFAIGAIALRDRHDRPRIVHQALAAFFAAAFVLLQIHQIFVGPQLAPDVSWIAGHYAHPRNWLFEETACLIIALGLLSAAFEILGRSPNRVTIRIAALIAAALLFVLAVGGLGGLFNPLFDGTEVNGWPILNRLLWYILAGGVIGVVGFNLARDQKSPISDALLACAVVLISLGAILIVRHAFAGPRLTPIDGASVGFFEAVMITIMLLALTAATRLWHDVRKRTVSQYALAILGTLAIAWAAGTLGLLRNPLIDHSGVFGSVIFNRVLWGYGALAIAFAASSIWVRDALPLLGRALHLAATATCLLGAFLLVRHGFHGPYLASDIPITLAESGVYAALGFAGALALMIAGAVTIQGHRIKIDPLSVAIAACGLFAVLAAVASPAMTDKPLAGMLIFDNALVGYLMPSLMAFMTALWARSYLSRPAVDRVFGATAILGAFAYVLTEVRRAFVGPDLFSDDVGASELYAYSAAILLFGVALLALGFNLRSKDLRLASLGVVTIAICKAFLVDMSGLEGLLRALSFIGLGGSLVAIGLAYQGLLRRDPVTAAADH